MDPELPGLVVQRTDIINVPAAILAIIYQVMIVVTKSIAIAIMDLERMDPIARMMEIIDVPVAMMATIYRGRSHIIVVIKIIAGVLMDGEQKEQVVLYQEKRSVRGVIAAIPFAMENIVDM